MAVSLVMFTQEGERREFEVREGKSIVGRNTESDIQVALGVISRRHCVITLKDEKIHVRDLGSSNGTYVNNRRVQEVELRAGDTLTVGPVIFTVVVNGSPAIAKPIKTMVGPVSKGKPKPQPTKAAAPAPSKDDTGSIDLSLDDSAEMEATEEDDGDNPLAELEELSKQKRAQR